MIKYLDKLNLRPGEKRLVVVVALFVFVLLNFWFITPHFGDWKKIKGDLERNRKTVFVFTNEIAKTSAYEAQKIQLEGQGSGVLPEEQALHFAREVEEQRRKSNVNLISTTPQSSRPGASGSANPFFENQFLSLVVKTGEAELVDFLYHLGAGSSLIRVESMTLNPDVSKYSLNATITLMASYQKKPKPVLTPTTLPPKTAAPSAQKPSGQNIKTNSPIKKSPPKG